MSNTGLKIAILSVHSSPLEQPGTGDTGGMSIYIREIARELAALGHMVDIYTRVQDRITPAVVTLAPRARQIHIQAGEPADLDKLRVYSLVPHFSAKTEYFRAQHNLSYDVIFSHYWISGMAGCQLQERWHAPHVIMFHTLGAVKNAIGIGENEPELRIEAERRLALTCRRIIASTEKERGYLRQYYGVPPEKVTVIPCGVNLDLFRPVDKTEARKELGLGSGKNILFAGRVERLKGVTNLVRSVSLLNGLKPELIIAGEDGNRPGEISQLKNEAAELGISSRVTFTGLVKYSQLPYYYNAADVCVFPSYYESFGLVPLESLACGTPVIATDVGDLRSIIRDGENGYILGDNQPQHLAEKIETVLSGRQGGLADRETIRASVLKYGWSNIAAEIEKEIWRKA